MNAIENNLPKSWCVKLPRCNLFYVDCPEVLKYMNEFFHTAYKGNNVYHPAYYGITLNKKATCSAYSSDFGTELTYEEFLILLNQPKQINYECY